MNTSEPAAERAAAPEAHRKDGTDEASLAAWIEGELIEAEAKSYGKRRNNGESPRDEATPRFDEEVALNGFREALRRAEYIPSLAAESAALAPGRDDPVCGLRRLRKACLLALADAVGAVSTPATTEPPPADKAKSDALVTLRGPTEPPIVKGIEKPRLTVAQYDVLKALMDAGDEGLTGDELAIKSGHGGAINVLKNLAGVVVKSKKRARPKSKSKPDPDWQSVIVLPGGPGKRYRLRQTEVDGH